jgi:two-component system, OmpR family, sensor histidine kinase BaeS
MKIRNQLTLSFSIITFITVLVSGFITYYSIHSEFQNYVNDYQKSRLNQWHMIFNNYYSRFNTWDGAQELIFNRMGMGKNRPGMLMADLSENERIILGNPSGIIVVDSKETGVGKAASTELSSVAFVSDIEINGKKVGTIWLEAEPPSTFKTLEGVFLSSVNQSVFLSGLTALIIAFFLAIYFSTTLSKPIKELTEAAKRISMGDFNHMVKSESKNEIGLLASAFNKMVINLNKNEHLRRSLVADVAHELRTPLSILRGNLESILAGITEVKEENVALLYDEVLRMSYLVHDLQELSQAEAGQLKLNKKMVDIVSLTNKVISFFQLEAEAKNIQLSIVVKSKIPEIEIDPIRIEQVIGNLVSNAIRYSTNNETIKVDFQFINQQIIVKVIDSGEGISPEELPYIFERFYRSDKARSRVSGGIGLGLAIAKGFVEMHGGTIEAANNQEKGSTFKFSLTLKEKCTNQLKISDKIL